MDMDPLSTMYTMHGPGRKPETRTEMILAIEGARDAAIAAFYADLEPSYGAAYYANESIHSLKALGQVRSVWRHVFEASARRLRKHARCVKASASRLCLDAADKLDEATHTLDALMDSLLVEHGI